MWEGAKYEAVLTIEPSTESLIEEVIPEEIARIIYDSWNGEVVDFGGGVKGITCSALLRMCGESPYKLSRKIKGLARKKADLVVKLCKEAVKSEPLR